MQTLKKSYFVRYFFVARILIIIGVAVLCFSSRYMSARHGNWIWQKGRSEQIDNQAEPIGRKKTHIKKKKKLVSKNSEQIVEKETVVAQQTEAEPAPVIQPSMHYSKRAEVPETVLATQTPPVSILESPAPAPVSISLESDNAAPSTTLNEADSYWNWLLNPRPWWEFAGQKSMFRQ